MLYKEPEELRDDTNNNCKGHYNRNTLLAIIVYRPGIYKMRYVSYHNTSYHLLVFLVILDTVIIT